MLNACEKVLLVLLPLSMLSACGVTFSNDPSEVFGYEKRNPREECLRALKWEQQRNLDNLLDDDESAGDRTVSAIIYSNTNDADDRFKCESLPSSPSTLEAVPEKPKPKKS